MDSATLPGPMQAPNATSLQTNNPQVWNQTDLQPQPSQQTLGNASGDIPTLLIQPNNHTIPLRGTRTDIINEAIASSGPAPTNPATAWLGVALVLVIIGLIVVLIYGRVWPSKRAGAE